METITRSDMNRRRIAGSRNTVMTMDTIEKLKSIGPNDVLVLSRSELNSTAKTMVSLRNNIGIQLNRLHKHGVLPKMGTTRLMNECIGIFRKS